MNPTDEQQAIFEYVHRGEGNLIVEALAGAGKTSTALASLAYIPQKSVLFCAFNKRNQLDLEEKMPPAPKGCFFKAQTFHAIGLSILKSIRGYRFEVDPQSTERLVNEAAGEFDFKVSFSVRRAAVRLLRTCKETCTDRAITKAKVEATGHNYDHFKKLDIEDIDKCSKIVVAAYIMGADLKRRAARGTVAIDFVDMTWLPVVLEIPPPNRYQAVFVDEAQDLSLPQLALVKKMIAPNGRIFAIGDRQQCHPPGVMVEVTGGIRVPIEKIKVGDQLVSYHDCFRGLASQGRRVLGVGNRRYHGDLITISAGGEEVRVTPDHRVPTRFVKDGKERWALYLMEYGGTTSRLGCCRLFYGGGTGSFGPSMRARHEEASRAWVLQVFDNEEDALLCETLTSIKFGIPEHIFKEKGQLKKRLLAALGDNRDRAIACLENFGRLYAFPMYQGGEQKHFSRTYSFVTQACNLLDGVNEVRTFDGTQQGGAWSVVKLHRQSYYGDVYSLSVEATEGGQHLYVADRILVHNCIYDWRGAVGDLVWSQLKGEFKAETLPLSMTFRCARAIVKQANALVPALRPRDGAAEGQVRKLAFHGLPADLQTTTDAFVLSRTNADLLMAALTLWSAKVNFQLAAGKEIVEPLYEIIDRLDKKSKARFSSSLVTWYQAEMSKAERAHAAAWADRVEQQHAMLSMMLAFAEPTQFKQLLADILANETATVVLSTVHKAKGLEADRVYLLKETFARHKPREAWMTKPIEQEELNIEYVAITRAREELVWVSLPDGMDLVTLGKLGAKDGPEGSNIDQLLKGVTDEDEAARLLGLWPLSDGEHGDGP